MTEERNNGNGQRPEEGSRQQSGGDQPKLGMLQMVGSSLAAAFGVQSQKNKERDFSHGDPKRFVIMGIGLTVVFLLVMMGIVKLVLSL